MTVRELAPGETALGHVAMRALRPHVAAEEEFVRRVDELQRPQGYRLSLHLDSGVGPDREDAHRLYLNAGMRISSHHFSREL